ncbi:type 1 glutamine amidotransferase domain-containing protein [Xanthomonas sp. LMC-A-07]|uniref:type 1 glutamine amidotransferase domain-containing protein n=1 Tax=Xanthomonas sp. LMC-A-07 TaxID=3040329 RepID=UPI0025549414|nr:type 1 glutamine amidotransferase domain-containing protein [Xanthomonas sp. LMC-A-07]
MHTKHVLFVLTNAGQIGPHQRPTGYFFPEVAHPVEVLEQAGIAIEFASPAGGAAPEDGYDASDAAQLAFRHSKAFGRMAHSRKLSEVDVRDYDAVFVPGGLGPMVDISGNRDVQALIKQAWEADMLVAAVCHGPSALLGITLDDGTALVQGRRVTGFSTAEEDGYARADVPFDLESALREEGALYSAGADWQPHVVVDGTLITGQNPASAGPLAHALVAALQVQA